MNLLNGTDNLIISGFINITTVGIFSNYGLDYAFSKQFIRALASSIQPGIGNMFVESDSEKKLPRSQADCTTFLFFLIVAVAACGLYVLIDPFVEDIWLGSDFLLGSSIGIFIGYSVCTYWNWTTDHGSNGGKWIV